MIHPNEYWTPQSPSVCLRGVTWKHCQFSSCCVCAGLGTTSFWQEASSCESLAVGGGCCNLEQGMQLVQLVTQKAKGKETLKPVSFSSYLGYRVKFQWIWAVWVVVTPLKPGELLTWCWFYMSGPGWVPAKSPRDVLQLRRSCQACTKGYQTAIDKCLFAEQWKNWDSLRSLSCLLMKGALLLQNQKLLIKETIFHRIFSLREMMLQSLHGVSVFQGLMFVLQQTGDFTSIPPG